MATNPGRTNLSAWWALDGDGLDSHTTAHNLTTTGAVTYTTGLLGSAATSFSTTKYLSVADHADFDLAGDYTVCGWCYPASAHTGVMIAKDNATAHREYDLDIDSGKMLFIGFNAVGGPSLTYSGNTYNVSAWNFLCARFNGTTRVWTIRLNGGSDVDAAALASVATSGAADVSIGIRKADTAFPFNGRVDNVAIYQRRLSNDEVDYLYNSGSGRAYSETSTGSALPLFAAQLAVMS